MGNQALRPLVLLTILYFENTSLGLIKEIGPMGLGIVVIFQIIPRQTSLKLHWKGLLTFHLNIK